MSETSRLIDQLERAHDGDPWHGSPVKAVLRGVTWDQAARRPPNGAHSIWEIVLHMTGWRNEVARRAAGNPAGEPAGGDWPAVGDATEARWQAALAAFDEAHRALVAVVAGLADDRMLQPTNDPRNRELGTGVTYYELLHGIVQHDAYHSGQIAILKKVLGL
ncbi:MAG TPA: DinB family protein [Vicinamibacterales bacterium]|nr:DinB family protein [Vicinamibacterales bacterium]